MSDLSLKKSLKILKTICKVTSKHLQILKNSIIYQEIFTSKLKKLFQNLLKVFQKEEFKKKKTQTEIKEEAANQAEEKGMFEEEEEDDDSNTSQYSEVPPS